MALLKARFDSHQSYHLRSTAGTDRAGARLNPTETGLTSSCVNHRELTSRHQTSSAGNGLGMKSRCLEPASCPGTAARFAAGDGQTGEPRAAIASWRRYTKLPCPTTDLSSNMPEQASLQRFVCVLMKTPRVAPEPVVQPTPFRKIRSWCRCPESTVKLCLGCRCFWGSVHRSYCAGALRGPWSAASSLVPNLHMPAERAKSKAYRSTQRKATRVQL